MLNRRHWPASSLRIQARRLTQALISGVVTLLLLIDEFGIVNEVSVVNAAPPGYFEDAAMAAFRGD